MRKLWLALLPLLALGPAQAQNAGWPPPAGAIAFLGVYNSAPVTLTNGQVGFAQVDANGYLKVNVVVGGISLTNYALETGGNLASILSAVQGPIPAGTNVIGYTNGDPCQTVAHTTKPISVTTATTTNIITGTSAKKTYICQIFLTAAAADNIAVVEGTTGGTCGSGTAGVIGGTTAANGMNFAANGGASIGNGGYSVAQTATNQNDVCIITSASTPLAGVVTYVQQ